jgi:hypothetical protein
MAHRRVGLAILLLSSAGILSCTGGRDATGEDDAIRGAKHTLYIHGRTDHVPKDFEYWGRAEAGPDPIAVNWDGQDCLVRQNPVIVDALDRHCVKDSCYVICHSAGCAQIEYALDKHGGMPNGKNRWSILFVLAAGSAEGGSELADVGKDFTGGCIDHDLQTTVMRAKYDHNNMRGVPIFMHLGAAGDSESFLLPGEDDGAVAYHSAAGARKIDAYSNPGGTDQPIRTAGLFDHRVLEFVDERSEFSHFLSSDNRGVVSVVEKTFAAKKR